MTDAKITAAMLDALKGQAADAIWATELALATGARRCDFWKLEVQASKGYRATAFEIKASRGDFRRDNPVKQREARLYSDRFYYVTPCGLIAPEEVPDWAGLIEWTAEKGLSTRVPAPLREKDGPSWELVVSLFRNSAEIGRDVGLMKSELSALRWQVSQLKRGETASRETIQRLTVENFRLRGEAE